MLLLTLTACSSHQKNPPPAEPTAYLDIVEKYSDKIRKYSGFYNTVDIEATVLNSKMALAQLQRQKELSQWDDVRLKEETGKFDERLNKEAEFFLSFFTPEKKNDDLSKPKSMWKIFLDVDGKRYEGKATKIKLQLAEIEVLYPYHNRFYTPYSIIFPVPMKSIDGKPMQLTLTGPVDSVTLNF